jgi:putative oxidoreductase
MSMEVAVWGLRFGVDEKGVIMPTLADWIALFRKFVKKISAVLGWLPPTAARLTLGWIFLQSGWGKLSDLPKVIAFFTELGIPAPQIQAPLAAGTEFLCGALMLLGFLTRFASLPLIGTMMVAILTARRADIHELSDLFGFAEYLYILLCLYLGAYGAGPISLDRVFAKKLDSQAERRLAIAA